MQPLPTRPALRRELRQLRNSLSPCQQHRASIRLYRQLTHNPLFRNARHIAFYIAADGEIDPTLLLWEALRRHKRVYLPVLAPWPRTAMRFRRYRQRQSLIRNRFAIAEPVGHINRKVWTLDLVLTPLVGFDAEGGRLGMGGGFFDRALAYLKRRHHWKKPHLLGLAHQCQEIPHVPHADWDIPMDAIVTDHQWFQRSLDHPSLMAAGKWSPVAV